MLPPRLLEPGHKEAGLGGAGAGEKKQSRNRYFAQVIDLRLVLLPLRQNALLGSRASWRASELAASSQWTTVQDPVSVALVACVHLALLSFGWPPGLAREVSSSDLAFARRRVCPAALIQRRARCSGFCASLSALRRAILASLPEREIASIAPLLPHNVVMGAYRTS